MRAHSRPCINTQAATTTALVYVHERAPSPHTDLSALPCCLKHPQAATTTALVDVARVSVLHASFMDYLLRLAAERYAVLAKWPDFTSAVGDAA